MTNLTNLKSPLLGGIVAAFGLCGGAVAQDLDALADQINSGLAAHGINAEIDYMEYITAAESDEMGQLVIFKDTGNKQLGHDFVPFDPRRTGLQDIQVIVDNIDTLHTQSGGEGEPPVTILPGADLAAFHSSNATWEGVNCANIPVVDLGNSGVDLGFVQFILGFGGAPVIGADVGHYGWLPPSFFNAIGGPGGGASILGVTFTFIFVGPGSDLDGNGIPDTAFREIYYNTNFAWKIDPNDQLGDGGIDIESVALHEMGHGLSQAHFGSGKINTKTGKITISPQAIMNAAHSIGHRAITGTDKGGHCSNWASWPNK